MDEKKKCRDCRYFVAVKESTVGDCHRAVPQTTVLLIPDGINMVTQVPKMKSFPISAWPSVESGQWCGEWRSDGT